MPTHLSHSRRPSAAQLHLPLASHHDDTALPSPASSHHPRSTTSTQPQATQPNTPTLLRPPAHSSYSSRNNPSPPRSRRSSNPTTPTLTLTPTLFTPGQTSASNASATGSTSPSYFSPHSQASGKDARSPASRKPPAFFSGHGIDASRGPPNSLVTRGNVEIARQSQLPTNFSFAQQQQPMQSAIASPGGIGASQRRRRGSDGANDSHSIPSLSRHNSVRTTRRERHLESSVDGSSEYHSPVRSQTGDPQARSTVAGSVDTSDNEQGEDLFIAAANSSTRHSLADAATRADRLRSRIAVRNNRQSFPSTPQTSSTPPPSRLPAAIDTTATSQLRRPSLLPSASRTPREQPPGTPANPVETPRSRVLELSPKTSFSSSSRTKDPEVTRQQFLAQSSGRRPSYPDSIPMPSNRTQTFRPSNLHYSSSRDNPETPRYETPRYDARPESASHGDATESLDSTGPAASVWDELDDLKSRIRRIELGGKIPTTSAAVVTNATGERPRTANTSITTVSSSPKTQRKTNESPPVESTPGAQTSQKVHPLLREALAKAKKNISPPIYRVLEATANEAMGLAELAGSAGPQGTLHSASSILNGALVPDRQVRRKADNICRSLTELCIELCDTKSSIASPAVRSVTAAAVSRRPSVQVNGESPQARASVEPESDPIRVSPSRALSRIEARRSSLLTSRVNGIGREPSQEPLTPSQAQFTSRLARAGTRAGTSFQRTRRQEDTDEEDDDPTLRAPSRAMTDFRDIRSEPTKRFNREYTSHEPIPELQPSPSLRYTSSLRRPTVSGHENNLLFRDTPGRFNLDRQTPAYEKQVSADLSSRLSQPTPTSQFSAMNRDRASLSGPSVTRTGTFVSRRMRGASVGDLLSGRRTSSAVKRTSSGFDEFEMADASRHAHFRFAKRTTATE